MKNSEKPVNIHRQFYSVESTGQDTVEINMYGDVVEEQPTDFWTGEPIEGDYITLGQFMDDLDRLEKAKKITIRMNSYGGDCVVAFFIHNRLRGLARNGAEITGIVDAVAMSAGSIIMAACDKVKVNPSSLIMIHRCWSFLYGGYNADELRQQAEGQEAYDKAICAAYVRKTGLSETVVMHMMSDTTYMTGKEAVEKGFADELIEDAEPLKLAASADGRSIIFNGRTVRLAPGMFAPDNIPTEAAEHTKETIPEEPGESKTGGIEAMSMDELRAQYPELIAEAEQGATAHNTEAINAAVLAERERLNTIDQVADLFAEDLVHEAKYGETACTAEQLAYRAALKAREQGTAFLKAMDADTAESNTGSVESACAPEEKPEEAMTESEKIEQAKALFKSVFKKGE